MGGKKYLPKMHGASWNDYTASEDGTTSRNSYCQRGTETAASSGFAPWSNTCPKQVKKTTIKCQIESASVMFVYVKYTNISKLIRNVL